MTEYAYKDYHYLGLFRLTLHGAVDPVRRYMAYSAYVFYNAAAPHSPLYGVYSAYVFYIAVINGRRYI